MHTNVYFYARTRDAITPSTDPNWMLLLLDANHNPKTGWEGFDFIVNRSIDGNGDLARTKRRRLDLEKGRQGCTEGPGQRANAGHPALRPRPGARPRHHLRLQMVGQPAEAGGCYGHIRQRGYRAGWAAEFSISGGGGREG